MSWSQLTLPVTTKTPSIIGIRALCWDIFYEGQTSNQPVNLAEEQSQDVGLQKKVFMSYVASRLPEVPVTKRVHWARGKFSMCMCVASSRSAKPVTKNLTRTSELQYSTSIRFHVSQLAGSNLFAAPSPAASLWCWYLKSMGYKGAGTWSPWSAAFLSCLFMNTVTNF